MVEHAFFSTIHAKSVEKFDTRDIFFQIVKLLQMLKLLKWKLLHINRLQKSNRLLLLHFYHIILHHLLILLEFIILLREHTSLDLHINYLIMLLQGYLGCLYQILYRILINLLNLHLFFKRISLFLIKLLDIIKLWT